MVDDVIPSDVKQFLLQHMDSIAQLEGLLIFRSNPDTQWDVPILAQKLYITEAQALVFISQLVEQRFIIIVGSSMPLRYQYRPGTPELAKMADKIADVYRQYLVPITNLIHTKPKNRVQKFADAFRIRKD